MAKAKTEVAVRKPAAGAVMSLQEQIKAENESLASRIKKPSGDKIKLTKKKTFKLPDGTETDGPLSVVILDFAAINEFFDSPYKEGEVATAACYAVGFLENDDLTPAKESPDVQNDSCKKCPNNEFGSKGNGKACANKRRLAVIAGEGEDAADPNSPMWIIDVSPTSIKAFDAYVASVRQQFELPPIGVITDVYFDPDSEYQSLRFGNPRENPNLEVHYARKQAAKDRLTSLPDFSRYVAPKKGGKR